MEELLEKINETFDNCMENSNEDTKLQLKIIKGNINTIMREYIKEEASTASEDISQEVKEDFSNVPSDRKRVLIVDDSSIVRNYLQKLLSENYTVDMAVDGQEAIERLSAVEQGSPIDVIILDLMMPNIDGFGVLEYMNSKDIKIPVMIISGDNTGETIARAFQYNVTDMIEKPFDSKTIQEKLNRIF